MTEKERAKAAEENYARMRKQLDERLSADKRLTAIADKIKAKTADFRDTAEYSELVSNHISAIIQDNIGNISSPLGKQYVCEALLKDHYTAINDVLGNVQVNIDERNGIHIAPQEAPYPAERVAQVAHALEDTTVPFDTIKRRAGAPVANVAKSFHDDYMKENAKFRSDAGIKCYINRTTDGNCCKWCSSIAGRYVYGEEPHDVFRRHDNCGCMTTYENGRERQDVWSKKSWEVPSLTRRDLAPARLSTEQARQLQVRNLSYRGLTNGGGSGIIKNIELPPETAEIRSMSEETRRLISDAFDKVFLDYDIQVDEILTQPLKMDERNVPFQFQPVRGNNGELIKRIVINSDYDFMGSQEQLQARILRNFNNGVLASNSIDGLIAHEAAHVMTFQDIKTYTGYLIENKTVSKQFVNGISGYADARLDGAECIAEAFSALRCQQPVSAEAQALVDKFIERWRKK